MDINIYGKYKIKTFCKYSVTDEYGDFRDYEDEDNHIVTGGVLLELLNNCFKDKDLDNVIITDGIFKFSFFNPLTGEAGKKSFEIVEVI